MTLAQRLVEQRQREKGGSLAQERFDYQALWGLALIFSNHESGEDYAIAFEFHDDVLLLDSAVAPANLRFYQVKTKNKGHWTLADLFRRPARKKDQKEEDRPLSFMGKLFSGFAAFPNETVQMSFVSNVPLEFSGASVNFAFKDCDSSTFAAFLKRLKQEHKTASEEQASLIHFSKADLSLEDASTHAKGKLHNFVVRMLGEFPYNLDGLYRAVVEDCRTRSKYTAEINTFADLIRYKAITRANVEQWLHALSVQLVIPDWSEIAQDLSMGAIQKARLRAEWMKYRAQVLDAGDEAIRTVRERIQRMLLPLVDSKLTLNELLEQILPAVTLTAKQNLSPYSEEKLMAMILYEVLSYGQEK